MAAYNFASDNYFSFQYPRKDQTTFFSTFYIETSHRILQNYWLWLLAIQTNMNSSRNLTYISCQRISRLLTSRGFQVQNKTIAPASFFIHYYRNSSLVSKYNMHKLIRTYDNTNNASASWEWNLTLNHEGMNVNFEKENKRR